MKIIFPSVDEMIEELRERGITEVGLVAVEKEQSIAYGSGERKFYIPHVFMESLLTAVIEGTLAECRIRHAVKEAYDGVKLNEARQRAAEIHRSIRERLKGQGFTVRTGAWLLDTEVFLGSVESRGGRKSPFDDQS